MDSGLREARLCTESNRGKTEGTDNLPSGSGTAQPLRRAALPGQSFPEWQPESRGRELLTIMALNMRTGLPP